MFSTEPIIWRDNAPVSPSDWEAAVNKLRAGYDIALRAGRENGLQVFFAWEYTRVPLGGTDLLTYGLDADWLLRHPEIAAMSINDYCDLVRGEGGFISHAHPFRESWYIEMIRLLPRKVDAVEVYNANRTQFENDQADIYASNYSLYKTAGTDNHLGSEQKELGGMVFSSPLRNEADFITAVRAGEAEVYKNIL